MPGMELELSNSDYYHCIFIQQTFVEIYYTLDSTKGNEDRMTSPDACSQRAEYLIFELDGSFRVSCDIILHGRTKIHSFVGKNKIKQQQQKPFPE